MYMIENFDFDRMVVYGTEFVNLTGTFQNPEYKKLTFFNENNGKKRDLKDIIIIKQKDVL